MLGTTAYLAMAIVGQGLEPPANDRFQQDVAWSPDGRWIACSENSDPKNYKPENWAVWIVRADGTGRRRIAVNALYSSWSPNGRELVYGSKENGIDALFISTLADGKARRLTFPVYRCRIPAWSPKGDWIAYCSDRGKNLDIYLIRPDGTGERRLTTDPARDYNPHWSADGKRIVFFREKGDGMDQIWSVAVDGSAQMQITSDSANNVFPCYLASGSVAFATARKDGPEEIVRIYPDGTRKTVLSNGAFFARWSQSERRMAFVAGNWPMSAIYVADGDGKNPRKIVN